MRGTDYHSSRGFSDNARLYFASHVNSTALGSLLLAGFGIAFAHAALPTHWLPFVAAGRAQGWSRARTLGVTLLAGGGHVLFTIALGVLITALGISVQKWTAGIFPYIAAAVLMGFGVYYWTREEHHHHAMPDAPAPRRDDRAVIWALITALTFSPCEGFLPVFIAGAPLGWSGFALLCAVLMFATLAGMLALTWLTLLGLERLKLDMLEHYDHRIAGGLLFALGLAVLLLEAP